MKDYFDFAKTQEEETIRWLAGGAPPKFTSEHVGSLSVVKIGARALSQVKQPSADVGERSKSISAAAFARDFQHRYRSGSSLLLKAARGRSLLGSAIRVQALSSSAEKKGTF